MSFEIGTKQVTLEELTRRNLKPWSRTRRWAYRVGKRLGLKLRPENCVYPICALGSGTCIEKKVCE